MGAIFSLWISNCNPGSQGYFLRLRYPACVHVLIWLIYLKSRPTAIARLRARKMFKNSKCLGYTNFGPWIKSIQVQLPRLHVIQTSISGFFRSRKLGSRAFDELV